MFQKAIAGMQSNQCYKNRIMDKVEIEMKRTQFRRLNLGAARDFFWRFG